MDNQLKITISNHFRNTDLGIIWIKKNLKLVELTISELNVYLKTVLLSTSLENIETIGKNHYFKNDDYNAILTVNSGSLTIITAKQLIKSRI